MAFVQCEYFSETLGTPRHLNVILPDRRRRGDGDRSPTLFLLHGLSDNEDSWMRWTSIERYARAFDLIVVMPAADRSFYTNMACGYRYWDYLAEELPAICASHFPTSTRREERFAAGLSMGGYGAFKLALSRPDRFAAAASLSGALDLAGLVEHSEDRLPEWRAIFGSREKAIGGPDDLIALARETARRPPAEQPRLFQCCGAEDYLYAANQSFLRQARELGLSIEYEEGPGAHDWSYWDATIQRALNWLPLRRL